jgi:tRNA (adenine-N(1)-)-methyltransferase non-catalytic subunit
MDTLALLLSLANVGANAEVLVLDMLGGLLTAAVAERLGGMQCIRTSSVICCRDLVQ